MCVCVRVSRNMYVCKSKTTFGAEHGKPEQLLEWKACFIGYIYIYSVKCIIIKKIYQYIQHLRYIPFHSIPFHAIPLHSATSHYIPLHCKHCIALHCIHCIGFHTRFITNITFIAHIITYRIHYTHYTYILQTWDTVHTLHALHTIHTLLLHYIALYKSLHHIALHYNTRHLEDIITLYDPIHYNNTLNCNTQHIMFMHRIHYILYTLHFITLRYITLHYITLHSIPSHHIILSVLHYIINYNTYHTLKHIRNTYRYIKNTLDTHNIPYLQYTLYIYIYKLH